MTASRSKDFPFKCQTCNETIVSDEEYLHDGESTVHLRCFACSNCRTLLGGRFYYRFKNPRLDQTTNIYCESCYFRVAPVCFQCLKIIDDISLTYGERIFHPNCFLCDHCQVPFKGALVFPYDNHLYCVKCYKNAQTIFRPASSSLLTLRCRVCRKEFQPGDLVTKHRIDSNESTSDKSLKEENKTQTNVYYTHNSCFVCEICHRNLANATYYSPNAHDEQSDQMSFQCEKCHQTSATICSICFKPSDDVMVIFDKRWYHDECFKCKNCNYKLKNLSRIITESDGFLCERCLKLLRDRQLAGK